MHIMDTTHQSLTTHTQDYRFSFCSKHHLFAYFHDQYNHLIRQRKCTHFNRRSFSEELTNESPCVCLSGESAIDDHEDPLEGRRALGLQQLGEGAGGRLARQLLGLDTQCELLFVSTFFIARNVFFATVTVKQWCMSLME